MFYVSSSFNDQLQNRDNPPPGAGATASGTAIPVTVYDFIAHEGLRTPLPAAEPPAEPLSLWYDEPASKWIEALPVGQGRIGAMVFGG
ncbi:MAG: glycoside hydrolase N-terminal domain-containing protein, partial [Candidatus Krumholzibacteriota bacterium]|nr:glycoside hydrolase N-terminal domain-containing protein [Candidatus Krumholzibacteriota bacterium]